MGKKTTEETETMVESTIEISTVQNQTTSKAFIKKLKSEDKSISDTVLMAFIKNPLIPKFDTEENYQNVWDTVYKRK